MKPIGSQLISPLRSIQQLRERADKLSIDDLSDKIEGHLFAYCDACQTQPFANFIIQRLLQSQADLAIVAKELIATWNAVREYKSEEILVTVYSNFVNDVFQASHIQFFVQTHKIID